VELQEVAEIHVCVAVEVETILRKGLRRYRVPAAVGAAFLIVVAASLVVSVAAWHRASRDRDAADRSRKLAEGKTIDAEQARREAEAQKARADERADVARRRLYANQIASIGQAVDGRDSHTRTLLDQCDPNLRGWEWYRLQWLADQGALALHGHEGTVTCVAFRPDGKRIVTASWDNTLKLWDTATGEGVLTLVGDEDYVAAVAFSPDGRRIASGGGEGTVRIWDANVPSEALAVGRDR
jgi:hypothetical protein